MVTTGGLIQALVILSTVLGAFFLWQVYPILPPAAFDFVAFGWALFIVDSALTFAKPRVSYYFAFVLAILALAESLSQPAHYSLLRGSDLAASATLVAGSGLQVLLLILVPYHFVAERRKGEWAWPGAKSQA